jgi:hypothetical protein
MPSLKETLKGLKRIRGKYIFYKYSKYAVLICGLEKSYWNIAYRRLSIK